MAEWKTMAAGRELDRVVAERLGETISFIADDGTIYLEAVTPAENGWPVEYGSRPMPQYSTSADAALTLPIDDDMQWELSKIGGVYDAMLTREPWVVEDRREHVSESEGTCYAEAICRAWLAWRDSTPPRA